MEKTLERPALSQKSTGRDLNLDLIRAVAAFLVVSVHFILKIDFYYYPVAGWGTLLTSIIRMVFMTCVPLFLILTGYLCCHKELSKRYFLGISRVLLSYLLASAVSLLYRWLYLKEAMTPLHAIRRVLDFTGVATGWYIEMYLGLFLLIPFLNMLWKSLDQRARLALTVTLLVLTSLPTLTNFRWSILPDWWDNLYPLAYYFMGAYFRDHQPHLPTLPALGGFVLAVVAGGTLGFLVNYGAPYQDTGLSSWPGPTVVISACLLFLLLKKVPLQNVPRWMRWLIRKGSELSLLIYLVSWCFDSAYYPKLWAAVPGMAERLPYYFIMVPAVYLSSAVVAQVLEWARKGIVWCINKAIPQAKLK